MKRTPVTWLRFDDLLQCDREAEGKGKNMDLIDVINVIIELRRVSYELTYKASDYLF